MQLCKVGCVNAGNSHYCTPLDWSMVRACNESLARKSVYSQPVTGCKSRAEIYTASHKHNTIGEICCCQLLVLYVCTTDPTHVTRKVIQNTRPSFCFSGRSGYEATQSSD